MGLPIYLDVPKQPKSVGKNPGPESYHTNMPFMSGAQISKFLDKSLAKVDLSKIRLPDSVKDLAKSLESAALAMQPKDNKKEAVRQAVADFHLALHRAAPENQTPLLAAMKAVFDKCPGLSALIEPAP